MFAKKMKTSDKKNKTFRFKDLYLPTFSLSLSGYRFILLFRKGRMLGVTAKLGTGFRGTCCRIRQNLYQDSEYFGKESRCFEAAQVYRVHRTSLSCSLHNPALSTGQGRLVPCNKVDKVVAVGIFVHKIMCCHHLSNFLFIGVAGNR